MRGSNGLLDLPDREVVVDRAAGELLLEGPVGRAQQRPGVAHAERAVLHVALDRGRELEEPQHVRDGGPALADPVRDLVVGELEVLDQLLVRGRFLERVELFALDVLDDRLLEHGRVVGVRG